MRRTPDSPNVVLLTFFASFLGAGLAFPQAESWDFNRHIRPILSEHCFTCHGPDERGRKADLRLDTQEGAFAALEEGELWAIHPGDVARSEVARRILSEDPDEVMPPAETKMELSDEEKERLLQWGYRLESTGSWNPKSPISRLAARDVLVSINADVVALQEIGSSHALELLAKQLEKAGRSYPFRAIGRATQAPLQLGFLSRRPFSKPVVWTQPDYMHFDVRTRIARGFLEAEVLLGAQPIRIINVHLKSAIPSRLGESHRIRYAEANLLRRRATEIRRGSAGTHIVLVGDFNASAGSKELRVLLEDERLGLEIPPPKSGFSRHFWTHYYRANDTYSKLDHLFFSPGNPAPRAPTLTPWPHPLWRLASDHRPILFILPTE